MEGEEKGYARSFLENYLVIIEYRNVLCMKEARSGPRLLNDKFFLTINKVLNSILSFGSGEGNPTHSSILAWRIPWTEEPDRLQFMGSQRVEHD